MAANFQVRRAAEDRIGATVIAHLRGCAICQSGTWCQAANRLGLTRDQRDASIAFDRALNPGAYVPAARKDGDL